MFHNHDPNAPVAPAVHVPALSSCPKASCFAPTVFRSASSSTLAESRGPTRRNTSALATASSAPPSPALAAAGEHGRREGHVSEGGHFYTSPPPPCTEAPARPSSAGLERTAEHRLSNEDFVEELVREVRLTCQRAQNEQAFMAETDTPMHRAAQTMRPVFVCPSDKQEQAPSDFDGPHPSFPASAAFTERVLSRHARSPSPHSHTPADTTTSPFGSRPARARSPSPVTSRSFSPPARFDEDAGLARAASPPYGSRRGSDDARLPVGLADTSELAGSPSTVALAASSRTSSPGPRVPQSGPYSPGGALCRSLRRNRSPGVARELSPDVVIELDADEKDYDTEDLANAAVLSGRAASEGRADGGRAHPQWTRRAVSEVRPGWNQRCPAARARPHLSAPTARTAAKLADQTDTAHAGVAPRPSSGPHLRSRSRSRSRSGHPPSERAAPASPRAEAPSRVLFTAPSPRSSTATTATTTAAPEAAVNEALSRAARAEARVEALEATVHALAARHEQSIDAWASRCAQLTQQVQFVLEWAQQHGGGGGGGDDGSESMTRAAPMAAVDPAHALRTPLHGTSAKTAPTGQDTDSEDGAPPSSPPDLDGHGATPTPVRRPGQTSGGQSGGSTQVRVPPSPPLVLQLQTSLRH